MQGDYEGVSLLVKVYFDTSIWIAAFRKRPKVKHKEAMIEFEKVDDGTYALLVSHHVLLEIHKLLIDEALQQPAIRKDPRRTNIRNFVTVNFAKFSREFLFKSTNSRLVEPATALKDVLEEAFEINQRVFGDAKFYPRRKTSILKYNGPLQLDILHAIIARDLGCDRLVTFDTGFQELRNESNLNPLAIEVIGSKSSQITN